MRAIAARLALFLGLAFSAPALAATVAVEDANAGVLAMRAGNYDEAIRLFTSALDHGQFNAYGRGQAYSYRGLAHGGKGDLDAALADLDLAVDQGNDYARRAYSFRGILRMTAGRASEAAADLAKSLDYEFRPYAALWLYFARAEAGLADADMYSLSHNISEIDFERWPGPVLAFFLGRATGEDMTAAIETVQGGGSSERRSCEAVFYTGYYYLMQGDAMRARSSLEWAARQCPPSVERIAALAELARLGN